MPSESVYDSHPGVYDAITFADQRDAVADTEAVHRILSHNNTPNDGVILDVGCGTMTHLAALPDTYTRLGVDLSHDMLAYGVNKHNSELHPTAGDMHTLPVQDSTVNVITCLYSTINYISSQDAIRDLASEWKRVLTSDGVIIVEFTPCAPRDAVAGITDHESFTVETDSQIVTALQSSTVTGDELRLRTAYTVTHHDDEFTQFIDTEHLTLLGLDTVIDAFANHGFTTTIRDDVLPLQTLVATL